MNWAKYWLVVCSVFLSLTFLAVATQAGESTADCEAQHELAYQHRSVYRGPWELKDGWGWTTSPENPAPLITANYMLPLATATPAQGWAKTGLWAGPDTFTLTTPAGMASSSGTQVTVQCEAGVMAGSAILNTHDTVDQEIIYGNVNNSFTYRWQWHSMPAPYSTGTGELSLSTYAHAPFYKGDDSHIGGHDTLSLFLVDGDANLLNYTFVLYAYNSKQRLDTERIRGFDPNNNALHVTSGIGPYTRWSSSHGRDSGYGTELGWYKRRANGERVLGDYFEVRLGYDEVNAVLTEACLNFDAFCDRRPEDFRVKQTSVHNELNTGNRNSRAISGSAHARFQVRWDDEE